jgi:cell division protein ZapA (FtsZ GTPase activity inhibitor)
MDTLIPVTVVIADRTYRIRIHPKDEEVLRKTVKTINDKVIEFRSQFAGKDMQDYIAMVLLWFATEENTSVSSQVTNDNLNDNLTSLEKMIDSHLKATTE